MNKVFCTVVILFAFVYGYGIVSANGVARLDVFHEVLEKLQVNGSALPESKVNEFFVGVLQHFSCNESGSALPGFQAETSLNTCTEKLCFNVTDLFALLGVDKSQGLTEVNFHAASASALFFLSRGQHPCNATINPGAEGATVDGLQNKLIASVSAGGFISEDNLETFLHAMEDTYEGIDHNHEEDHDDHDDHGNDHSSSTSAVVQATDNGVTDGNHVTHDEHDEHDHDKVPVVEAKCLAPDSVMYYLRAEDETSVNATSSINDIAAIMIYLMHEGSAVEEKCRILPKKSDFLRNLIIYVTGRQEPGANFTEKDFFHLMDLLNIIPKTEAHNDHAHADHGDHKRKRRSVSRDVTVSRVRRQAAVTPDKKCYKPEELRAVFEAGDIISGQKLTEMSPALIIQKMQGNCNAPPSSVSSHTSHNPDRWWLSTIAVAMICLCSVLGVVLVPCMNKGAYHLGMALFIGLAVGSLTGDALLHLIPATMGAHAHSEEEPHGHDHGKGKIVVEEHVWYSLVTLAGIYLFYLLESMFSRCLHSKTKSHGHSHSFDLDLTIDVDEIKENGSAEKPTQREEGNKPLCVMIILGDAVHNFADGLAIGASFSASNTIGLATAIAVICHELPHELGDFAVLLKSGMSPKKAVFWNLISSLTAFAGLYVSLAVSTTEDVQTWIFAIAAGMFLYIALTDLLPTMVAHENTSPSSVFALHNVGLLLGVTIMLIIAIFEEHITID